MSRIGGHWTTLGEIAEIISGSTPKTSDPTLWDGDIPWLTPADLSGYTDKYIAQGRRSISAKGFDSCSTRMIPAGSVLMSSRAPIGHLAINTQPVCTNQGFKSLVPAEYVDSSWLYYFIRHNTPVIRSMASGTTFLEISAKKLATIPVFLPPIDVQREIVELVESALTKIGSVEKELKETAIRSSDLVRSVLRGEFVPSQFTEPQPLGTLVSVRYGKDVPKTERSATGTYPVVGSAGIMCFTERFLTTKPAVLIGRKGNVGSVQLFLEGCHPVDTAYLVEVPEGFIPEFLFHQLQSMNLKSLDSSTAIPSLRREDLEAQLLIKPPIEQQIVSVERITEIMNSAKRIEDTVAHSLITLAHSRASLLNKFLSEPIGAAE